MPVIGMLLSGSRASYDLTLRAFHQGLAESGYVEARNVAVEYRWAEDRNERFPQLAAELVQRGVSVIAAVGSPAVAAAKATTTTIPIVFYVGVDPVLFGLVIKSQPARRQPDWPHKLFIRDGAQAAGVPCGPARVRNACNLPLTLAGS